MPGLPAPTALLGSRRTCSRHVLGSGLQVGGDPASVVWGAHFWSEVRALAAQTSRGQF